MKPKSFDLKMFYRVGRFQGRLLYCEVKWPGPAQSIAGRGVSRPFSADLYQFKYFLKKAIVLGQESSVAAGFPAISWK